VKVKGFERPGVEADTLESHLVRGLDGDDCAYHAFLSLLTSYLRVFLRRQLSWAPGEVEDVLQECLLAIHNKRYSFDRKQPLDAWVNSIARYKLIDFIRRSDGHESHVRVKGVEGSVFEAFESVSLDTVDAKVDIRRLLDLLPPAQRLPIVHTKLNGLSVAEVAQATGMSESAIKVGVHRGLKALAAMLGVS
jgi:RNA polymerase sigma-70 factor, ECF subfamily